MARDRSFTISIEDYETEEGFRAAVRQAMLDCEGTGHREGGAFVQTPIRVDRVSSFVDNGGDPIRNWVTIGWMFSHTFMPAARIAEAEHADEWQQVLDEVLDEEAEAREAEDALEAGPTDEQVAAAVEVE